MPAPTMAATANSRAERSALERSPSPPTTAACPRSRSLASAGVVIAGALCGAPSHAERWQLDTAISSDVTATNNSLLSAESPQSDVIISVRPRFVLLAEGARLKVRGSGSLNAVSYTRKTQESRALPDLDLNAVAVAIERALTLEAGARVSQQFENPFGLRVDPGATTNRVTTTQYRFSPVLDIQSNGGARVFARSDNIQLDDDSSTLNDTATTTATGYFGHHNVVIEQQPRPLGARIELDRTDTRYKNAQRALVSDIARAVVTYSFGDRLTLGLRGGGERNNFVVGDETRAVYGVEMAWQPTERTDFSAAVDHRYFGTGGRLVFNHRMPWVVWNLLLTRDIVSTPQTLFDLPPTDNVAALLDQLYTTRFPDPIERSRQVQEVISRGGLPASLSQSTTVYSQRISLQSYGSLRVAYVGTRNSVALSGFWSRLEDAPESGALATALAINNNIQQGMSLTGSRRMTPTITLKLGVDRSTIKSLGAATTDQATEQRSVRADLTVQLAPRTSSYVGVRHTQFIQNQSLRNNEDAAFVGIDHRF
jgi:uncharacterized protein (PEP-CTERM system associated)